MLRWVAVVGVVGGVGAAVAEPVRMTTGEIQRVMQPGAVLEIDTPLRISIPVKVDSHSMVSAEAGALGLTLGALKDRGRWWTENDQLCMKWFRWFDAKARCITLRREGNKVFWYENSGESGTATITEAPSAMVAAAPVPEKSRQIETAAAEVPTLREEVSDSKPTRQQFAVAGVSSSAERSPLQDADILERRPNRELAPAVAPVAPKSQDAAPARPRQAKSAPAATRPGLTTSARKTARTQTAAAKGTSISSSSVALISFRVSRVDNGDTLNVRSGPSEYHEAVGAIPAGGRGVQIVGVCQELWCPIRHGRLKGWVNRYYLAEDPGQRTADKR